MTVIRYAFDRSARSFDENGHLHVEPTNISKAAINPYYGREIPNAKDRGLDPARVYNLLRHPDELAKAADSFNGLPVLEQHVPVSASDPHRERIVGTTGSDATFLDPYLKASLVIWDGDAIDRIENGSRRQLSCGYRYDVDMTPGEHDGASYDGVMRNIKGNHVALVEVGRAGPDVIVGDREMAAADALSTEARKDLDADQFAWPEKRKLPIENAKHVREAWDLIDDTDGLEGEEKARARRRILAAAKKFDIDTSDWKGAQDADHPASNSKGNTMPASKKARLEAVVANHPKLAEDENIKALMLALDADDPDETEEERKKREEREAADKKAKDDAEEEARKRAEADKDDDKKAMDAAISAAVAKASADTEARTVARMQAVAEAQRVVRPVVGDVHGMDTAEAVFKYALDEMKVDVAGVPEKAYGAMFKLAAERANAPKPRLGMDSAFTKSFDERFPNVARIKNI